VPDLRLRVGCLGIACWGVLSAPAAAQEPPRWFAGALFGVSALAPDARAAGDGARLSTSLYDAGLGPALNVFGGIDVAQYFSVQANWMWNRNDLTLFSSFTGPTSGFYEQHRRSGQHAVVLDGLVYFRRLDSVIRPYLGTGLSIVHFSSDEVSASSQGLTVPPDTVEDTRIGLRSHVGIDFRLSPRLAFRYSFSETISSNPISPLLTPPAEHGLMNFQNLFGFLGRF
jgi:outer membrane protein W